ncbi:MAG: PIN domain-containing protein [Pseudomonadota bacterium]
MRVTVTSAQRALAIEVIGLTQEAQVGELDTTLALAAAATALEHRLALADAVVYPCARSRGATLVTSDAHFEHLPGVRYLRPAAQHAGNAHDGHRRDAS